jgi:hypothetical protein
LYRWIAEARAGRSDPVDALQDVDDSAPR